MSSLDHIGLRCIDLECSLVFYRAALAARGLDRVTEVSAEQSGDRRHVGFGRDGKPSDWLSDGAAGAGGGLHLAFVAADRAQVNAVHRTWPAAGGRDNGAPGLRPHDHPNYYGAFLLDPDGHNLEAVCHQPAST
ncbi:VOC family protein [Xanthomonas graminis]|uniref:Glyoxalase/bleomycin resistance protein/dioxygenase n=1 Tax=Xanthomonas graminis pv. phlei TaxID=487906 RepID=A0A0K2ZNT7_9XANT|nr:VOC family protein [Xanthomonas translucens]UKE64270.1 VOC family protein [Xanthomonas translucens pv. phlei]CTP86622.1 glyoxalase/bleomycin resistance protein/dioxygenase [Xanthomonas translucens pv. phlei]